MELEGNSIYLLFFRRTLVVICANAQKSREPHAEGILEVEKTRDFMEHNFGDTITLDHNVLNEEYE